MNTKAEVSLGYGSSGTTKTSQIGELAEYILDKYGLKTRMVTSDGGGCGVIQDYVDAGIIQVLHIGTTTANPLEQWDKACQGYWPTADNQPAKEWKKNFAGIGAYAFEGLTSVGDLAISYLRRTGQRLSQDPNYAIKDGDTSFYGSNMTYFGFAQDRVYDLVMKSHMLDVQKVYWTALEAKGEEDGTKLPTFGPAIAGKKSISRAPQWFGNCIHYEQLVEVVGADANKQAIVKTRPVMYVKPHAEPLTKIPFPAKLRIPPNAVLDLEKVFPNGCVDPPSLRKVFEFEDKVRAAGLERLRAKVQSLGAPAIAVNR